MRIPASLLAVPILLLFALPALAAESAPGTQLQAPTEEAAKPMDSELAREHQRFSQFARQQVERMNANILGGKNSMHVRKGSDGMYRASYKAIDLGEVVFRVHRAQHDPRYFVGDMVYKELVLESVGQTAEACRRGSFATVAEKPNRIIYSSKRGGGWD
ncbi:MAG: hypothetical protein Q7I92_01430 [Humidesulfovibrio sp.]|nr:hypothetical protein [Humidesulfovibrio sp.]